MKSLTEHWTDAELAALPPRKPPAMFSPFAEVVGHPVGEQNAKRWFPMHDGPGGGPAPHYDPSAPYDPLAGMLDALGESPMHVVTDPKTGEPLACFPARSATYTRAAEDEWETRARAMHENQGRLSIAGTPEEPIAPTEKGVRPTFHSLLSDPIDEVPKFEDWIKTQKGD